MMKISKNLLQIVLVGGILVCFAFSFWTYLRTPKIAFVRSSVIIENYQGMKEAKTTFDQKSKEWTKNIDTLGARYTRLNNYLINNKGSLSKLEIKKLENEISQKASDYKSYTTEIDKIAKDENDKLTQGAFNQINSFIERYSKEHNIDIVIGTTLSGSVLYGADKIDITDKVLEGLNKSYR